MPKKLLLYEREMVSGFSVVGLRMYALKKKKKRKSVILVIIDTTFLFLRNEFSVEKLHNRKFYSLTIRDDRHLSQLQIFELIHHDMVLVMSVKH